MKKFLASLTSKFLSLIALSSVSVASPYYTHRAKAPDELLKK